MSRSCVVTSTACGKALGHRALSGLAILLGASGLLILAGCGAQNGMNLGGDTSSDSTGVALQGKMMGGQAPVTGATINLMAASISGYATTPTTLYSTTTDSNGNFSFPTGSWSCPAAPGDQVFLLGIAGNPGNSGGAPNPNLVQMAALGSCSGINSGTFVVMNEVTTVASAYALAQFISYTSGAIDTPPTSSVTAGTIPYIGIPTNGSSCNSATKWLSTGPHTCNYVGLKNAMLTVQNLVNTSTGNVPSNFKVPSYTTITAGNDSYTPAARINALANILSSCVNSTGGVAGGAASNCNTLFTALTPTGAAPPTDTLQAILILAQNPQLSAANNAAFYGLAGANAPFNTPPALTAQPNDWAIALGYTSGGLTNLTYGPGTPHSSSIVSGMAIDQQGNVWATSSGDSTANAIFTNTGGIVGITNQGAPISPNTTTSAWGAYPLNSNEPYGDPAIDVAGNIYFGNYNAATYGGIKQDGTSAQAAVTLDSNIVAGIQSYGAIAVDHSDHVWIDGYGNNGVGVAEYTGASETWSNISDLANANAPAFGGLSLGSGGTDLYISTSGQDYELNASTGAYVTVFGNPSVGNLAVDSSGNVWGCGSGNVFEDVSSATTVFNQTGGCFGSNGFGPQAIDGLGNLWAPVLGTAETNQQGHLDEVATTGTNASKTVSPATYGYQGAGTPDNSGASTGEGDEVVLEKGIIGVNSIVGTAVDPSGNIWVLNGQASVNDATQQLVEFVGLGAPTVTPKALAAEYGTFSQLP